MLLYLSIIGILLSIILLTFHRRSFGATIYLGFFFLSLSFYALSQYILLYSKSVELILFFLYNFAFLASVPYLIGPMLFWYIRSVLSDNAKLKIIDGLHLLPVVIYFLLSIPQNLSPHSDKMADALALVNDTDFIAHFVGTPLAGLFPIEAIFLSRPLLVIFYALFSARMCLAYLFNRKKSVVFSQQHFMTKWLCLLLGFLMLLAISQLMNIIRAFSMDFSEMYFTLNFVRILSGLGLIGLLISPLFFPAILYGLPQMPDMQNTKNTGSTDNMQPEGEAQKSRFNLESDYLSSIHQKVEIFMKQQEPYLQPGFNLPQLAMQIQVPAHHLSYFFREIKKQSFNDYRNEWRINHAKKLIKEGKATEMTLEAIGILSGFSSRNTFISDFKKFEGESPGSYAARFN